MSVGRSRGRCWRGKGGRRGKIGTGRVGRLKLERGYIGSLGGATSVGVVEVVASLVASSDLRCA